MALSNAQLLMLDNLIYTDFCDNGDDVGTIIKEMADHLADGKSISGCEMTNDEWKELINMIEKEPSLHGYTVQNYVNDESGMRAACFVDNVLDPQDVNVVFRGTSGDYEWHDNGEGGYLTDTQQQIKAAEYVDNLPNSYGNAMTVTGHSKGGNKAQYVTIVTNRIAKCVSYDGQGFSEEFISKYREQIQKKANSIVSISASDDFVNCLLYPIAGTRLYLDTEEQKNFLHYHKPNILFDENGNLRGKTQQSDLSKFINEYTTYMISNLDEPERSLTVDGLIALLEKGENKEHIVQTIYAGGTAISHLDDFAFSYIGEAYGVPAEILTTYVAALACPYLFADDLLHCGKEMVATVLGEMYNFAQDINAKLQTFGDRAKEFGKKFVAAIDTFSNNVNEWFNQNFNSGYKTASSDPMIKVHTAKLRAYAGRLIAVNNRLVSVDRRMDELYLKVGLRDLFNLIQADLLTGSNWRVTNCAKYLDETANDFDAVERNVAGQF